MLLKLYFRLVDCFEMGAHKASYIYTSIYQGYIPVLQYYKLCMYGVTLVYLYIIVLSVACTIHSRKLNK